MVYIFICISKFFCNQGDYTWNHAWTEVSCIFFNIYSCTMYIKMYHLHSKIIVALGFSRVKICEVWKILKVQFKRTENVNASAPKYWMKRQIVISQIFNLVCYTSLGASSSIVSTHAQCLVFTCTLYTPLSLIYSIRSRLFLQLQLNSSMCMCLFHIIDP